METFKHRPIKHGSRINQGNEEKGRWKKWLPIQYYISVPRTPLYFPTSDCGYIRVPRSQNCDYHSLRWDKKKGHMYANNYILPYGDTSEF